MRRYLDILTEAPLTDFGLHGDTEHEGSLRIDDIKAAASQKWLTKVSAAFARSPFNWNIYFYNGAGGKVDFATHKSHIDRRDIRADLKQYMGIYNAARIAQLFGIAPPNTGSSISVIFVSNEGTDRLPFTPWILAHRIVHAVFYAIPDYHGGGSRGSPEIGLLVEYLFGWFNSMVNFTEDILVDEGLIDMPYDSRLIRTSNVARILGKMKSARQTNLTQGGEFLVELLTQNIVSGALSFNRPKLHKPLSQKPHFLTIDHTPRTIHVRNEAEFYKVLDRLEDSGNALCQRLWQACVGKIFLL